MQSHFDQSIKQDYKTSSLAFETLPKSHFGHSKVNINGNVFNISNHLSLASLNNEQQFINSDTNWDITKVPSFIDYRLPRLYNHLINQIFLQISITTTANCKLLPFSALIDKITISRSNSLILQTIEWEEILLFNKINSTSSLSSLNDSLYIWSEAPINTTTKSSFIKLPTIFPSGTLLDKFESNDLKIRVYFKTASKLLTSDSTSQDSTKVGLSNCVLVLDLNEIPISTYNTIMKEEWLDYYCVVPEVYDPYTPNLEAAKNYDLLLSEFKNTAIGFGVFQKQLSDPVKNEDETTLFTCTKMQLKHQNNQEIFPELTSDLLKTINSFKLKSNSLVGNGTLPNFYFWCNDVTSCVNNNYLLDGWYNFGNENQKLSLTMPNATTEIFILFFKICITRISRDAITVINS